MPKKVIIIPGVEEIKKHLKDKKLVIGTDRTLKLLKLGRLSKVFLAVNCAAPVKADVERYSKMSGAEVQSISLPNEELGVICTKPFSISVLGILKE